MSFVNHGGLGKEFPAVTIPSPTPIIWTEDRLRSVLVSRGVWPSSISGNVEYWYPQVLADVQAGIYTFEEFVEEFANHEKFHFGETLERLREPASTFGGGWLLD